MLLVLLLTAQIYVRLDRKVQRAAEQVGGLFWIVALRGVELDMNVTPLTRRTNSA